MVLFKEPNKPPEGCFSNMFAGQGFFETLFVLIAVAAIPVMLFAKPWHIMKQRKNANVSINLFVVVIV